MELCGSAEERKVFVDGLDGKAGGENGSGQWDSYRFRLGVFKHHMKSAAGHPNTVGTRADQTTINAVNSG